MMRRCRPWLPVLCLLCGCCPDDRPTLLVSVFGIPDEIRRIHVRVARSGGPLSEPEVFTRNLDRFSLRLPAEVRGVLTLAVDGFAEEGCVAAQGTAEVTIEGSCHQEVSLGVVGLNPRLCDLTLVRAGDGKGVVISTPPGTPCGEGCARYSQGTPVTLSAGPDLDTAFGGFTGACESNDTCQLVLDAPQEVTAKFFRIPRQGGWEWDNPLPQGNLLTAIWGSKSDNNIYAVGTVGTIVHFDGAAWRTMPSGTEKHLYGVWGSSGSDVYAVGEGGKALRLSGGAWKPFDSESGGSSLKAVWGAGPDDVVAVGAAGLAVRSMAMGWKRDPVVGTSQDLNAVWGSSAKDLFAVGDGGKVKHWDGGPNWLDRSPGIQDPLFGVWGDGPSNVFVVGHGGVIWRWDGAWHTEASNTTKDLYGVWGPASGAKDVYAVGAEGTISRYNGSQWASEESGAPYQTLAGVWGRGANDVYAVGGTGLILHRDGTRWESKQTGPKDDLLGVWGGHKSVYAVSRSGLLRRKEGTGWQRLFTGGVAYYGVWGIDDDHVYIVGGGGAICYWDQGECKERKIPVVAMSTRLWAVCGSGPGDLYAVGDAGVILHSADGVNWSLSLIAGALKPDLHGLWCIGPRDAIAVGQDGIILRFDGNAWQKMEVESASNKTLWAVWGSGKNDLVAVGDGGTILRWAGDRWKPDPSVEGQPDLRGVAGSARSDVFVIGDSGTVLHWDGMQWQRMTKLVEGHLTAVWAASGAGGPGDVFAVGGLGVVIRYRRAD